jgi:hypothetical protein
VMERIGEVTIPILAPADQLLGLCLHVVKHCPAVRHYPRSPLLARRVLLDGWLTQMVDIGMALDRYQELDWETFADRARSWGTEELAYAALSAAASMLDAPVPDEALNHLRRPSPGNPLERVLTQTFLDPDRTLNASGRRGKMAQYMLSRWRFQEDAVFHPLRLLDLASFFFPRRRDLSRWLARRHLKPYAFWWMRHALAGWWRLCRATVDLVICRTLRKASGLFRRQGHAPYGGRKPRQIRGSVSKHRE